MRSHLQTTTRPKTPAQQQPQQQQNLASLPNNNPHLPSQFHFVSSFELNQVCIQSVILQLPLAGGASSIAEKYKIHAVWNILLKN